MDLAAAALVIVIVAFTCELLAETDTLVSDEDLILEFTNGRLMYSITNTGSGAILRGELGIPLSKKSGVIPEVCADDPTKCIQYGNDVRLKVVKDDQCYKLTWNTTEDITLTDCFDYDVDNWYGGPENKVQYWPFSNMTFKDFSYVTKEEDSTAVAEPYWVTSSGFYIFVDKKTPLFIDANNEYNNGLCLIAKQSSPYLSRGGTYLGYKICKYDNAREAHINAVKNDLGSPSGVPDRRMITYPIWSTWVRYKTDVNESIVRTFAEDIVKNGFNNSQIEIDDNWETCYGSSEFSESKFSDMPALASYLKSLGFRITLWTHPFVNVECSLFYTLLVKGYLVKNQYWIVFSTWWDGVAGVVDFTNPEAAQWFLDQRRDLMAQNSIDGLKLDGGESSWLPQIPKLNADLEDQPNAFSSAYVRTVAQFGSLTEVRVGHGTQDLPIFVRMLDKDSRWTFENGLPTLLTTLFQMNLNGYTLVLPDMVGGNEYGGDTVTKELFIRWLQANTFMPAIQFSIAPFDFDEEAVQISMKFTALHAEYSDKIIEVMERSVKYGFPVNPPIWWVAPTDPVAHSIWDEYLLGEDTLVAPVLEEGKVSRDIYIPCGVWRDEADPHHRVYIGQRWLRNYSAPLDVLPYFTRVVQCDEICK